MQGSQVVMVARRRWNPLIPFIEFGLMQRGTSFTLRSVLEDFLGRVFRRIRMLSHLRPFERYDEPETLPCSIRLICLMSADGGQ